MATQIFLTSGTTWTVPSDWSNTNNTIECIGAGGTGGGNARSGGGGGAYSKVANLTLTSGASITIQVGATGTWNTGFNQPSSRDTYFNGASLAASSVGARGGADGEAAVAGSDHAPGGDTASGVGTTKFKGGNSGSEDVGQTKGGGGGGAGGPNGAGANGSDSGGNGGTADNGSGGTGGTGGASPTAGGAGTVFDGTHGSGGGGGGGNSGVGGSAAGLYGGGGGGAGLGSAGGAGKSGLIVITYTPEGSGAFYYTSI